MIINMLSYKRNIEGATQYEIVLYKDRNNKCELEEYFIKLQNKKNKDSKIKINKIIAYINMLSKYGTSIGEPYIKYIKDNIWELRPLRDRILFTYWDNDKFILLNVFTKSTQKTPKKEIEKAKRNLKDFMKRSRNDGE